MAFNAFNNGAELSEPFSKLDLTPKTSNTRVLVKPLNCNNCNYRITALDSRQQSEIQHRENKKLMILPFQINLNVNLIRAQVKGHQQFSGTEFENKFVYENCLSNSKSVYLI